MSDTTYRISYPGDIPDEEFRTKAAARRYLEAEAKAYEGLFTALSETSEFPKIQIQNGASLTKNELANFMSRLIEALEDSERFHRLQDRKFYPAFALPPPSASLYGRLVQGLLNNQRKSDAISVYLWFALKQLVIRHLPAPEGEVDPNRGQQLVIAATATEALPFRNETSQRLAGAIRKAENHAKTLAEEIEAAQTLNAEHEKSLSDYREEVATRGKRIEKMFFRRERKRLEKQSELQANFRRLSNKYIERLEKRVFTHESDGRTQIESQAVAFKKLQDLFHTHMRLEAPVQLWKERGQAHAKNAGGALTWFISLSIVAVLTGILVPFCFGDYIAASFTTNVCDTSDAVDCTRVFSVKGPLTVSGLLLAMSLVLWVIRLQYRVYLSERHLALDAQERAAFAQTFLAIKEKAGVGGENEALVLASLFRPTQDGIIKDDDNSLDPSVVALLAKQVARN